MILLLWLPAFNSFDDCMFFLPLNTSRPKTSPVFACVLPAAPIHGVTLVMFEAWRWVIDAWLTPHFGASPFWKCRFCGIALSESADFGASKSAGDSKRAVVAGASYLIIPHTGTGFPRFCPGRRPLKAKKTCKTCP